MSYTGDYEGDDYKCSNINLAFDSKLDIGYIIFGIQQKTSSKKSTNWGTYDKVYDHKK